MAIYTFTCKACHQQIRVKAAQGEALERELCEACALDEALGPAADEAEEGTRTKRPEALKR